jgi:fluoride exporter
MGFVWVALGGALGSVARYGCAALALRWFGPLFPWGTLFVNVVGSFAIGALAGLTAPDGRPLVIGDTRAFLIIGVLGGFTTFSSFSLDTLSLARQGAWVAAGTNVLASVALCLLAVYAGYLATVTLQR